MADYSDRYAKRSPRTWWKLGEAFEKRALELAKIDVSPHRSLRLAQAAECCFWQATGEGEVALLLDLAKSGGSDE